MKDIDLSSMISLAQEVFDILEVEYKDFLSNEKKEFIKNLDFSLLFKIIKKENFPPIYFLGDTFYLNSYIFLEKEKLTGNDAYSVYLRNHDLNSIFCDLVLFLCIRSLCGEINPLKLGLIELEIRKISKKYSIRTSNINNYKELEIGNVMQESLLNDLPFNIIFLDTDLDIFNYLAEEKGSKIANLYCQLSNIMKDKYKGFDKNNFSLETFIGYYQNIDYQEIIDRIYDFISLKTVLSK